MRTFTGGRRQMPADQPVRLELGSQATLPELTPGQAYAYIGCRRRADLKDDDEIKHVRGCVQAVIAKVCKAGLGRGEWARAVRERVGGIMAHHGAMCPALTNFTVAEQFDRLARGAFRRQGRVAMDAPNYDLYAYQGWVHSSAEAAGALYATVCALLASPVPNPASAAAQSGLALTLYMWGCMGPPLSWDYAHILPQLGEKREGYVCYVETWLRIRGEGLKAEGKRVCVGEWVGREENREGHILDGGHETWEGVEGAPLFEGDLMDNWVQDYLGRRRKPRWHLLAAGIKVLPHVCTREGAFMTEREAGEAWPDLHRSGDSAWRGDWRELMAELGLMRVAPVVGCRVTLKTSLGVADSIPVCCLS